MPQGEDLAIEHGENKCCPSAIQKWRSRSLEAVTGTISELGQGDQGALVIAPVNDTWLWAGCHTRLKAAETHQHLASCSNE